MKKIVALLIFTASAITAVAQTDSWALFAKTKFEAKYNEKAAEYFLYPVFAAELKNMVGKEISIEGYYLPIEIEGDAYIILSKFPTASAFSAVAPVRNQSLKLPSR